VAAADEILREQLGPDHPHVATAHGVLAKIASARRDVEGVRRHSDRAIEITTRTLGEGNEDLDDALVERARLLAEAGERDEALEDLRALVGRPLEGTPSRGLCIARRMLAELLWSEPEQRAEARRLATAAAKDLRAQGFEAQAAEAETWLSEHLDDGPEPASDHDGR
jgi:hypothetical protein